MTDPYRPPRHPRSTSRTGSRLSPRFLVLVSLAYGGCGSLLSSPMAALYSGADGCNGAWAAESLCDLRSTLTVSTLACLTVPTLVHAWLVPRLGARLRARCFIGACSVVAAVVVTFGCWRLLLDVPLLWAGAGYLFVRFVLAVLTGLLLSPVGLVLGGWLKP